MDGFFTAGMATTSVGSESLPLALAVCESLADNESLRKELELLVALELPLGLTWRSRSKKPSSKYVGYVSANLFLAFRLWGFRLGLPARIGGDLIDRRRRRRGRRRRHII